MSDITRENRRPEIRAILDTGTHELACSSSQPVCEPDEHVTAQLVQGAPLQQRLLPWRIANAARGDLILCPGGPAGMIGGLLSQLDPPQIFSHMGIMVKEEVEIRHATAISERMQKYPHRSGPPVAGSGGLSFVPGLDEAPTDGFQEDALRFGWPGTITQSIDQVVRSPFKPKWVDSNGQPILDEDGNEQPDPQYVVVDPALGAKYGRFYIKEIGLYPVRVDVKDQQGQWHKRSIPALVVKPCPTLETSKVRDALHRIADAAEDLRGHYRFFGYTRADLDPAIESLLPPNRVPLPMDSSDLLGPVLLELVQRDPSCPNVKTIPVANTVPMMCSSFIWLSVQHANLRGLQHVPALPRIILDGRPFRLDRSQVPMEGPCRGYLAQASLDDRIDPHTPDGLYFYGRSERLVAGTWLYNHLHEKVVREVAESTDLKAQLDDMFKTSGTVWDIWSILKILYFFPLGMATTILGVSGDVVAKLVTFLSDMPADVANQVCNAFAHDDCRVEAKDNEAWQEDPGDGYTVSPDNIVHSWALPTAVTPEYIHGVYGFNAPVALRKPRLQQHGPPPATWQISRGTGYITGVVKYRDVPVHGADVRIGCRFFKSGPDGQYGRESPVPEGLYWATARWQQPSTGLVLEHCGELVDPDTNTPVKDRSTGEIVQAAGRIVRVPLNGGVTVDFTLCEPPENLRVIWAEGHMDLVNRYAIGKDWWAHPDIDGRHMAPAHLESFPDGAKFDQLRQQQSSTQRRVEFRVDDWGFAELECDYELDSMNTLHVSYRARLKRTRTDPWQTHGQLIVPPDLPPVVDEVLGIEVDPGVKIVIDLIRSEAAWPVRAHIELVIHNVRES